MPSPNYRVDLGRPVSSSSANQHVPGRSGEPLHQIWGYPIFFPSDLGVSTVLDPSGGIEWFKCHNIVEFRQLSTICKRKTLQYSPVNVYIYIFRPRPFQTYCPFMSICRFVDVLWHEALFLIAILDSCEAGVLKTESDNLILTKHAIYSFETNGACGDWSTIHGDIEHQENIFKVLGTNQRRTNKCCKLYRRKHIETKQLYMLMPMVQATIFVGVKWKFILCFFLPKNDDRRPNWLTLFDTYHIQFISNICSDVEAAQGGASPVVSLF